MNIFGIYAIGWLGMMILAILNGLVREKTYGRSIGELPAHQLSTLTGLILFGLYMLIFTGIFRIESAAQALVIGGMWLGMTLVFEFGFGRYVAGHSWQRLLHDYNVAQGRVWVVILVWTAIAPYLFFHMRS